MKNAMRKGSKGRIENWEAINQWANEGEKEDVFIHRESVRRMLKYQQEGCDTTRRHVEL